METLPLDEILRKYRNGELSNEYTIYSLIIHACSIAMRVDELTDDRDRLIEEVDRLKREKK